MISDAAREVLARLEDAAHAPPYPKPTPSGEPKKAHFTIAWNFDGTKSATVTINRRAGTFEVRPFRRRKSYVLPLADVADIVAHRIAKAAVRAKLSKRRARR